MERRAIAIQGIVQGVGFRPFVFRLATALKLHGFVKNQTGDVMIEVEGDSPSLDRFLNELQNHPPPLAKIETLTWRPCATRGDVTFEIHDSDRQTGGEIFISPDIATCDDCLRELFDPSDRRFGYPFINCTNCGPRLTIVTGAPYDRSRTTMRTFAMCEMCRAEYENPTDRRFHAQPTCCPACGPTMRALDADGRDICIGDEAVEYLVENLRDGKIAAIKGLGGYHLACDAANDFAVAELRRRKHRDEKPFAVMAGDLAAASVFCNMDARESELLLSPARPIVLLAASRLSTITPAVAPGNPLLGVMLPYTPLHHLLMRKIGRPIVMTSGNRSDEPIAHHDADAVERLAGIADVFIVHNREIHVRCDDSVTRIADAAELPMRRSRGYAPSPIRLSRRLTLPTLAVGGQLKSTFALGRGHQAFVSHHLGDLDHFEAYRAFERDVKLYEELFDVRPRRVACDLHPDYASTRYASSRAASENLKLIAVQHHHAHMAGCMAENGLDRPVIGVCFDGTGYGTDGAVWGGEFLIGDFRSFRRAAHLRYVPMPGGDMAIREPWRMADAHRIDSGIGENANVTIRRMIDRKFNCPITSSMGRLFDAVAAMTGLRERVSYEGQAAIELEWLAGGVTMDGYPIESSGDDPIVIDTRPIIRAVAEDVLKKTPAAVVAQRFHRTIIELIVQICRRLRDASRIQCVTLSGGTFNNLLLSSHSAARLREEGFSVFRHRLVPPGDGGISLGQLAIAAATEE